MSSTPYTFALHTFAQDVLNHRHKAAPGWMRGKPLPYRAAAAVAGVSAQTILRAERSRAVPDVAQFLRLCAWMNASPSRYFIRKG